MSRKLITLITLSIGLIIFIVTLAVFFLGYANHPNRAIDWLGLIFVLISEIALFKGTTFILAKKYTGSRMLFTIGIVSTLFIYCIITCILSIFSKYIFLNSVGIFATAQIILMAAALIISIALYAAGRSVHESDAKVMYSKIIMKDCETLAFSLKSNTKFSAYSSLLNKIYEEIKYSDKTKLIEEEQTIYDKIRELEEILSDTENKPKVDDVSTLVDEIILLIKERNLSVLQLRQGGF